MAPVWKRASNNIFLAVGFKEKRTLQKERIGNIQTILRRERKGKDYKNDKKGSKKMDGFRKS